MRKLCFIFFLALPLISAEIKDKQKNIYKEVKSPYTGKVWLDRNLGATKACESYDDYECYGDYYQWGRGADGHQKRFVSDTFALSASDTPGHKDLILTNYEPYDWREKQNDQLWQGVDGINNPCPKGFRLPTIDELKHETLQNGVKNRQDALTSFLKLPAAGFRNRYNTSLNLSQAAIGSYWTSSLNHEKVKNVEFTSEKSFEGEVYRTYACSVRCIKD